jgi:4'-phosphopantetheinyl transferase
LIDNPIVSPFPDVVKLPNPGDLHLWSARVQGVPGRKQPTDEALLDFLCAEERSRAERYRLEAPLQQFVRVRALLRCLLGQYLQQAPQEIQFCYSAHGKPALMGFGPSRSLSFNLSHSGGVALFAVAQEPVGIDLEWINPQIRGDAIARRRFSAPEQAELSRLSPSERQTRFFQLWTRKEALIKLFGDRLFAGLNRYDVRGEPLCAGRWIQAGEQTVWLQDIDLAKGFAAAVASDRRPDVVRHRIWDWSIMSESS